MLFAARNHFSFAVHCITTPKKTEIYALQHLVATMWTTMFEQHDDTRVVLYRRENWAMSFLACWQLKFRVGVIVCNADPQVAHLFMDAPHIIVILAVLRNFTLQT